MEIEEAKEIVKEIPKDETGEYKLTKKEREAVEVVTKEEKRKEEAGEVPTYETKEEWEEAGRPKTARIGVPKEELKPEEEVPPTSPKGIPPEAKLVQKGSYFNSRRPRSM